MCIHMFYIHTCTQISHEQIKYLCEEAYRGDCEGQRAEIAAARVAIASAAFDCSTVGVEDLRLAVRLAIVPRSRLAMTTQEEMAQDAMPPSPSSSSASSMQSSGGAQTMQSDGDAKDERGDDRDDGESEEQQEETDGEGSAGTTYYSSIINQ